MHVHEASMTWNINITTVKFDEPWKGAKMLKDERARLREDGLSLMLVRYELLQSWSLVQNLNHQRMIHEGVDPRSRAIYMLYVTKKTLYCWIMRGRYENPKL